MAYRQEGSCIIGIPDPPYTGLFNGKTMDEAWQERYPHHDGCTCGNHQEGSIQK